MIKLWSLMALLILSPPASSQDSDTKSSPEVAALKNEIERLKERVEFQKEASSDLLNTLYFTLGVTLTVLLTMLGWSWYQTHRVHEKELAELRKIAAEEAREATSRQILAADEKFAGAFEKLARKQSLEIASERLSRFSSIFRTTHHVPTPRTDFMQLLGLVSWSIGRADEDSIREALSTISTHIQHVKNPKDIPDSEIRELIETLSPNLRPVGVAITAELAKRFQQGAGEAGA